MRDAVDFMDVWDTWDSWDKWDRIKMHAFSGEREELRGERISND